MGCNFYAFLRGIRMDGIRMGGSQFVRRFTWYPHVWVALGIHFYMMSVCLSGALWLFLHGMCMPGGQFVCVFIWYLHAWSAFCRHVAL